MSTSVNPRAWGFNNAGQLGDGTNTGSSLPVTIRNLTNITALAAGHYHSLALLADGTVQAWGNNEYGQLGDGTNTNSNLPVKVRGLNNVIAIAAGHFHSLALLKDGTLRAWGDNSCGKLGDGTNIASNVPVKVKGLSTVIAIAAGDRHSLAVLQDGSLRAWGSSSDGQLGIGSEGCSTIPVPVKDLDNAIAVAAGNDHSLALLKDGSVWAWGNNSAGKLGNGSDIGESTIPVKVTGLGNVAAIAAGGEYSLALLKDGSLRAWGNNSYGQLGIGTNTYSENIPVTVAGLSNVTAVSGGSFHSLALLKDGSLRAWGQNSRGQLGNGTNAGSNVPIAVSLSNAFAIAAGGYHSLAVAGGQQYAQTPSELPDDLSGRLPVALMGIIILLIIISWII